MWQIVGPNGVTNTTGGVAVPLPEAPVPPDTAPRHAGVGATVQTAAQTTVHPAVRAVTAVDATRPVNFGPLKRLAADPRVTDILVTCDGAVWVERGLGIELEHPSIPLDSPAVVRRLAVQLCAQLGERLDDARPIADASGADGTRVHAVIAPVVPYGASISIRLPSRMSATMDALQQAGCWPAPTFSSPAAPARARRRCSRRCCSIAAHPNALCSSRRFASCRGSAISTRFHSAREPRTWRVPAR